MKLPVYIYARPSSYSGDVFYRIHSDKYDFLGTLICETDVEFPEAARADVVNGEVKLLRASQQEIRAKAQVEIEKIDAQIGELLAIEDKS